jgi:hypothetical protein
MSIHAVGLRPFDCGLQGMVFVLLELGSGGGCMGCALQCGRGHGGARGGVGGALALPASIKIGAGQHKADQHDALGPPQGGSERGDHPATS